MLNKIKKILLPDNMQEEAVGGTIADSPSEEEKIRELDTDSDSEQSAAANNVSDSQEAEESVESDKSVDDDKVGESIDSEESKDSEETVSLENEVDPESEADSEIGVDPESEGIVTLSEEMRERLLEALPAEVVERLPPEAAELCLKGIGLERSVAKAFADGELEGRNARIRYETALEEPESDGIPNLGGVRIVADDSPGSIFELARRAF